MLAASIGSGNEKAKLDPPVRIHAGEHDFAGCGRFGGKSSEQGGGDQDTAHKGILVDSRADGYGLNLDGLNQEESSANRSLSVEEKRVVAQLCGWDINRPEPDDW